MQLDYLLPAPLLTSLCPEQCHTALSLHSWYQHVLQGVSSKSALCDEALSVLQQVGNCLAMLHLLSVQLTWQAAPSFMQVAPLLGITSNLSAPTWPGQLSMSSPLMMPPPPADDAISHFQQLVLGPDACLVKGLPLLLAQSAEYKAWQATETPDLLPACMQRIKACIHKLHAHLEESAGVGNIATAMSRVLTEMQTRVHDTVMSLSPVKRNDAQAPWDNKLQQEECAEDDDAVVVTVGVDLADTALGKKRNGVDDARHQTASSVNSAVHAAAKAQMARQACDDGSYGEDSPLDRQQQLETHARPLVGSALGLLAGGQHLGNSWVDQKAVQTTAPPDDADSASRPQLQHADSDNILPSDSSEGLIVVQVLDALMAQHNALPTLSAAFQATENVQQLDDTAISSSAVDNIDIDQLVDELVAEVAQDIAAAATSAVATGPWDLASSIAAALPPGTIKASPSKLAYRALMQRMAVGAADYDSSSMSGSGREAASSMHAFAVHQPLSNAEGSDSAEDTADNELAATPRRRPNRAGLFDQADNLSGSGLSPWSDKVDSAVLSSSPAGAAFRDLPSRLAAATAESVCTPVASPAATYERRSPLTAEALEAIYDETSDELYRLSLSESKYRSECQMLRAELANKDCMLAMMVKQ